MAEGRDIIVIGGSAGALEAIAEILPALDPRLPAAVLIVIHSGQEAPGYLAKMFQRTTPLAVRYAQDREPIELGTIYVAPPNLHLLVKPGEVRVVRGPRENNFRPAIDPLFRSAAYTYGPRVIGVILSGLLDDGMHGMFQIKQQGGLAIAQSPDDALQPSMPLAAIDRARVDHIVTAREIGALLNRLALGNGLETSGPHIEQTDVAEGMASGLAIVNGGQPSSPFICPDCGGALWEVNEGNLIRYRCHVGHGYTAETLHSLMNDEIEQALWVSIRLLEEQAEMQKRIAGKWHTPGNQKLRERFEANSEDRQRAAELIRTLLTGRDTGGYSADQSPSIRHEYLSDIEDQPA